MPRLCEHMLPGRTRSSGAGAGAGAIDRAPGESAAAGAGDVSSAVVAVAGAIGLEGEVCVPEDDGEEEEGKWLGGGQ